MIRKSLHVVWLAVRLGFLLACALGLFASLANAADTVTITAGQFIQQQSTQHVTEPATKHTDCYARPAWEPIDLTKPIPAVECDETSTPVVTHDVTVYGLVIGPIYRGNEGWMISCSHSHRTSLCGLLHTQGGYIAEFDGNHVWITYRNKNNELVRAKYDIRSHFNR